MLQALAKPGNDERLIYVRSVLDGKGLRLDTAAGQQRAREYLLENVDRFRKETLEYARAVNSVEQPNKKDEVALTFFQQRGLSLDTSLFPNFALEQTLMQLKAQNLLPAEGVRRIAIVGPGLDFADKNEGYDFYPVQTVQPFGVMDSLVRLGLARVNTLDVVSLDISSRTNAHLTRARAQARRGNAYVIQLPLDRNVPWTPEVLAYWQHFGEQIGHAADPVAQPASLPAVNLRAVSVNPQVVERIRTGDLNIVWQRQVLLPAEKYDMAIATNILIYYGPFEQRLAMSNFAAMLKPGGLLLSNNVLPDYPASGLSRVAQTVTPYSTRVADGDRVIAYRRSK